MITYWIAQGTLLNALWQPEWEGNPKERGCVCVCVCIYTYMHVCTYIYTHTDVYTHTETYISDQISCSVVSDSLRPHESQHTRLPCLSLSPGVCSDSCPLSQGCHPTIPSSVIHFSSCPQSFSASGSFPVSQLLTSGGQSIGASACISPSSEYTGLIFFRIDWLDLLTVQGTLKSLFQHHSLKVSVLQHSAFFMVQLSHPYMTIGKTIALTLRTFVSKGQQSDVSAF